MESQTLVVNEGNFPVRGTPYKIPLGVFMQKMISNNELVNEIASIIIDNLDTEIVAAHDYDGLVVASEICKRTNKQLLFLQRNTSTGKLSGLNTTEGKPFQGKKATIITGVLATGTHSADAIELYEENGGKCKKIIAIFDYGFNLQPAVFQSPSQFAEVKKLPAEVHSIVTLRSTVIDSGFSGTEPLEKWISAQGANTFRKTRTISIRPKETKPVGEPAS